MCVFTVYFVSFFRRKWFQFKLISCEKTSHDDDEMDKLRLSEWAILVVFILGNLHGK